MPRISALLAKAEDPTTDLQETLNGAITLMQLLYGSNSSQERQLVKQVKRLQGQDMHAHGRSMAKKALRGAIQSMKDEIDAGVIGSLRAVVTGEILADFIKLSRTALDEEAGENGKNVAAVLAAAAFEDTIRRIAERHSIPHIEKLADVITELKNRNLLQKTQVTFAQSYLAFRNRALHAQWGEVDRASVNSVLGFVEQLILSALS
jgi:hypothetical protein